MCLALKLFIKMCIACRYFIVWLQQLSPHLLGCSQRDQAKCCSHISKCDDYSCLATLDQTWFHLCCKCHFKWLSVCRSPCSPSFHFSNSFLSTIHPCVYNSLPLNSLFSISSVIIYYRHLFFNNIPLANSGLLTFLVFISCLFLFRPSFPSFALFPQLHSFSILVDFFSKSLITYEFLPRCTSFAFWASSHFSTCLLLLL